MDATTYHPYALLGVFLILSLIFPLAPLGLAYLWSKTFAPAKPGPDKSSVYECGLKSQPRVPIKLHSGYYVYALVFLIFDVESIFLFPLAVSFTGLATGAIIGAFLFVLLLLEGLVWAWSKGLLKWS